MTQDDRERSFKHWTSFCDSIGFKHDPFLDNLRDWQRHILLTGFAAAVRSREFARKPGNPLVKGTIQNTIGHVAQTFRSNHRPDPRLDGDGKACSQLKELYRAYQDEDPNTKQQKAVPAVIIEKMNTLSLTPKHQFIGSLVTGAFFHAMRSCEYSKTSTPEKDKQTKILRLKNIRFYKNNRLLAHTDAHLIEADLVDITFEFQKTDKRFESVSMHRTTHPILCPVKAWTKVVTHVRSLRGTTDDTKVNQFSKTTEISAAMIRTRLRTIAIYLGGETTFGFHPKELGTHSIRSGAAMAMHLAQFSATTIQLIGRWSSDAFLLYIRRQVAGFSRHVADRMINNKCFFTTPSFVTPTNTETSKIDHFTSPEINGQVPYRYKGTVRSIQSTQPVAAPVAIMA